MKILPIINSIAVVTLGIINVSTFMYLDSELTTKVSVEDLSKVADAIITNQEAILNLQDAVLLQQEKELNTLNI